MIEKIEIQKIVSDKKNPRTNYEEIDELSKSITNHGQLIPMTVEKIGQDQYIVTDGHRRLRALQKIQNNKKNTKVYAKCIIENKLSQQEILIKRAAIDSQMKNLSVEERDNLWKQIWNKNLTEKEFAEKVGTSTSQVKHFLDRQNLSSEIKKLNTPAGILQETIHLKPEHREYILKYAHKTGIGAMGIRQEIKHLKDANTILVKAFSEQKIDIDLVKKLKGLNEEKQQAAIDNITENKKQIQKIPSLIQKNNTKTKTEKDKKIANIQEFVIKLNDRIENAGTEIRLIKSFLEQINEDPENMEQLIPKNFKKAISESLKSLDEDIDNSKTIIKNKIKEWRSE